MLKKFKGSGSCRHAQRFSACPMFFFLLKKMRIISFPAIYRTASSENFSSTDEVAKDSDSVFHKEENSQATTPTLAKSATNTASQPLRRRVS